MQRHAGVITIVLALREGLMLEGIKQALAADRSLELLGEVHDEPDLIPTAERLQPDVVLLDTQVSELGGLALLASLRSQHPEIDVVMLFPSSEEELIQASFEQGAAGFVIASINPADLGAAIRQAIEYSHTPPPTTNGVASVLTPRETEVLEAVARGLSNKAIAAELSLAIATVKFHLTNAYRKLRVSNRTEAARWLLHQDRDQT